MAVGLSSFIQCII